MTPTGKKTETFLYILQNNNNNNNILHVCNVNTSKTCMLASIKLCLVNCTHSDIDNS